MKYIALLFLLLLPACKNEVALTPLGSKESYIVQFNEDAPYMALVSLDLKPNQTGLLNLISRAESLGTKSQVFDVQCNEKVIRKTLKHWPVPTNCTQVKWKVRLDKIEDAKNVRPSEQRSLYMPSGWWVLSGATSLLRVQSETEDIPIHITGSQTSPLLKTVYNQSAPPNFYVIGNAPEASFTHDSSKITYYGEDLDTVLSIIKPHQHIKALNYFKFVIGEEKSRSQNDLSVVWFGAPRERHQASGAAGYDTIMANYIVGQDDPKQAEQLLSLMLVFHEQFHQMSSGSHPIWMGESLANYYALKALSRAFPDNESERAIWNRFINTQAPPSIGLLDIQKQIIETGNRQNYGLLYTQGASFWFEIDEAIKTSSSGKLTLDNLMPQIMKLDISNEDVAFLKLQPIIDIVPEAELRKLKTKYLN